MVGTIFLPSLWFRILKMARSLCFGWKDRFSVAKKLPVVRVLVRFGLDLALEALLV
jgi:hypothetical protein